MSLNWRINEIKNHETVCYIKGKENEMGLPIPDPEAENEILHPVTWALIWATMAVNIGSITEANHEEFFKRLRIWEKTGGAYLMTKDGERYITYPEVKAHIGLWTNASFQPAAKTRNGFMKRIMAKLEENASYALSNAKDELKENEGEAPSEG